MGENEASGSGGLDAALSPGRCTMTQSLSRILVHVVFSTREREPWLTPSVRGKLHAYLAGTLAENGCPSLRAGGVEDHVHLLFGLSRTHSIAQVVEAAKTGSSKWMK